MPSTTPIPACHASRMPLVTCSLRHAGHRSTQRPIHMHYEHTQVGQLPVSGGFSSNSEVSEGGRSVSKAGMQDACSTSSRLVCLCRTCRSAALSTEELGVRRTCG